MGLSYEASDFIYVHESHKKVSHYTVFMELERLDGCFMMSLPKSERGTVFWKTFTIFCTKKPNVSFVLRCEALRCAGGCFCLQRGGGKQECTLTTTYLTL